MRSFRLFTILAAAGAYLLIFVGGLVRVSGAGLGCPDWPKCLGRWIPPLNASQLPPEIDPHLFNFTLAWIEYINRLLGVTIGILIAIVGVMALVRYRKYPKIVVPSVLAALLTAFQGWQGSQVVASELAPLVVSAHLVIALIIASLLIYVWLQAYHMDQVGEKATTEYPAGLRRWVGVLWVVAILQVILGTQVRQAFETAVKQFPLLFGSELISQIGVVKYLHPALGIITAVVALVVVRTLLQKSGSLSPLLWQSAWTIGWLVALQLSLGVFLILFGNPAVIQVLHLWIASLFIGVILISYTSLGMKRSIR